MASSYVHMFDEQESALIEVEHPAYGGTRMPDGRALAWAEYGSPRGVPCILLPDAGSSRLSPGWLLHDSALPSAIRLLAVDRPGTGASDAVGLGGILDPADDLRRLVATLAVGRVALIGIGQGADEAFAFAARSPELVTSVTAVSVRLDTPARSRRGLRQVFGSRPLHPTGGVASQWAAAGVGADLRGEVGWVRALDRMPAPARAAIGDRWREQDFRVAVAADIAEGGHEWSGIDKPASAASWTHDPAAIRVPVQLWHGQDEAPSSLSEVRSLADDLPHWRVSAVAGPSAVLGFWPQILTRAAASFSVLSAA